MGILRRRINHIIKSEDEFFEQEGQDVTFSLRGEKHACSNPDCHWDERYQASSNPTCSICGGKYWIYSTTSYTRKALIHWVTGLELKELEMGGVKVGDCTLTFSSKDKSLLNTLLTEKGYLFLDKKKLSPKSVTIDNFGTTVVVITSMVE